MSRSDTLPAQSQLHAYARSQDFMDCFSVAFSNEWAKTQATMPEIAALATAVEVPGAQPLMRLRDLIVSPMGLKTADDFDDQDDANQKPEPQVGDRIGFFKIYSISENEVILGEDDTHQDFRVSIFRAQEVPSRLYLATCCQRHNLFGHLYLAAILPFHKMIVKGMLDGVAKKLSAAGDAPVAAT
ncbi:DUF2867 domain-containing protein [Parvibaculaceae bacterium PLY_AMNH_Bact1]|nr:DUF2867 domain-containing protein [Parvibaculaceae bacterium PLY_AMNH_Bact1]